MQENGKAAGKSQKKSWFKGLQSEFRKIIWTDRPTLIKQTIVVVLVTILLGVIISIFDAGILQLINFLMK
ncbi:MAG: preprotein translocase subunit SecE [Eubacteriales bacterium]|nr:preprotein translocase subunit SecE [Eubacteriales bacterium]